MKPSTRRQRPDCGEKKKTRRGRSRGCATGSICGTLTTIGRFPIGRTSNRGISRCASSWRVVPGDPLAPGARPPPPAARGRGDARAPRGRGGGRARAPGHALRRRRRVSSPSALGTGCGSRRLRTRPASGARRLQDPNAGPWRSTHPDCHDCKRWKNSRPALQGSLRLAPVGSLRLHAGSAAVSSSARLEPVFRRSGGETLPGARFRSS